jgi:hypothetical protein
MTHATVHRIGYEMISVIAIVPTPFTRGIEGATALPALFGEAAFIR